mmetsp:Transcript_8911/g.22987  ORF Transcript_8911/g.22987 Transcript_8911/m.22987 type:complete len:201 (+) Transcript_8911:485-1087(+)
MACPTSYIFSSAQDSPAPFRMMKSTAAGTVAHFSRAMRACSSLKPIWTRISSMFKGFVMAVSTCCCSWTFSSFSFGRNSSVGFELGTLRRHTSPPELLGARHQPSPPGGASASGLLDADAGGARGLGALVGPVAGLLAAPAAFGRARAVSSEESSSWPSGMHAAQSVHLGQMRPVHCRHLLRSDMGQRLSQPSHSFQLVP